MYGGVEIHIFLASALVGGEWSASRPCRFPPGKEPPVPILLEVGWTPEPVWTIWRSENIYLTGTRTSAPPGRPASSQSLYPLSYPGSVMSSYQRILHYLTMFSKCNASDLSRTVENYSVRKVRAFIKCEYSLPTYKRWSPSQNEFYFITIITENGTPIRKKLIIIHRVKKLHASF
jgi:hypothetical protein